MTQTLQSYLRSIGACRDAREWVGDRDLVQAWAECPRGDWLLWWLDSHSVDCSGAGYWCADRAKQSALTVFGPYRTSITLRAVLDSKLPAAEIAAEAAALAAEAAARSSPWAYNKAEVEEHRIIADYIRANYTMPAISGVT